jgi:hypothetical protein
MENRLRKTEKKALRKIHGLTREHYDPMESSSWIYRTRRKREMLIKYWSINLEELNHLAEIDKDGNARLKRMLEENVVRA